MSDIRPTPETDAACFRADYYNAGQQTPVVHADFARNLERERDEARERAESKNGLWVSELSRVTELEKQIQTMLKHDATRLESDSLVGSCDCQTKTPETKYHKPGCKYRLIYERDEARERERVAVAWWDEERLRRQRETISLQQQLEAMREAIMEAQTALLRYEVEDVDLQAGEEMSISVNADDQQSLRAALAKLQPFLP